MGENTLGSTEKLGDKKKKKGTGNAWFGYRFILKQTFTPPFTSVDHVQNSSENENKI